MIVHPINFQFFSLMSTSLPMYAALQGVPSFARWIVLIQEKLLEIFAINNIVASYLFVLIMEKGCIVALISFLCVCVRVLGSIHFLDPY